MPLLGEAWRLRKIGDPSRSPSSGEERLEWAGPLMLPPGGLDRDCGNAEGDELGRFGE